MKKEARLRLSQLVGELVEDFSADGVIVAVTRRVKNGATETFAIPFGNLHTCRGLAEYIYDRFIESDHAVDDDEDEDEDDEDDE